MRNAFQATIGSIIARAVMFVLVALALLAIAAAGCGGSPPSTSPPELGVPQAEWEYLLDVCALGEGEPETWGDAAAIIQETIDFVEGRPIPRAYRDYFGAQLVMLHLWVDHAKQRDQSAKFTEDEAWQATFTTPEMQEANAAQDMYLAAMDQSAYDALSEAGC